MGKKMKRPRCLPAKDVEIDHAGEEDHLSQLPDELICEILSQSQLSVLDAYRTSLVSRRWEKLWLLSYTTGPNLIFSHDYIPLWEHLISISRKRKTWPFSLVDRHRHLFTTLLNKVLMSYHQPIVDEFVINFYFNSNFSRLIHEWISFAFSKGVQRLHLDLSPGICFLKWETPYAFPSTLPPGIHKLRDVCLKHMYISQESVDALLSSCPLLEKLSLQPENELSLEITGGPRLKLNHLELVVFYSLNRILISAPNLTSLSYHGRVRSLHLLGVPLLSEFCVDDSDWKPFLKTIELHISYLSQLKNLKLVFSEGMILESMSYPLSFPKFPKLEQLEVTVQGLHIYSFLWLIVLIKASPMLHRFSVKSMVMYSDLASLSVEDKEAIEKGRHSERDRRRMKEATRFSHKSLRVVEMSSFKGLDCEVEFLQHLFEIGSQSLEKVVIDTRTLFPKQYKVKLSRKLARSLGKALDPHVQFVVL